MLPSRILLIGNGEEVSAKLLRQLTREHDVVIAADGGATKALRAGVEPDYVVGDLDSISKRDLKKLQPRIVHVPCQQNTDLEKALYYATHTFAPQAITLVGFVGDRWDFALGNVLHVARYARKYCITLAGNKWRMRLITCDTTLPAQPNKRVSLVPLTPCRGVTLTGLKYPLSNETLSVGTTRSLSNETVARKMAVQLSRGVLLVYWEV